MRFLLMFVLVVGISSTDSKWKPKYTIPKNALTCDVCKALMTGIGEFSNKSSCIFSELMFVIHIILVCILDNWITSDKTEQEIIDFFNQICEVRIYLRVNIEIYYCEF